MAVHRNPTRQCSSHTIRSRLLVVLPSRIQTLSWLANLNPTLHALLPPSNPNRRHISIHPKETFNVSLLMNNLRQISMLSKMRYKCMSLLQIQTGVEDKFSPIHKSQWTPSSLSKAQINKTQLFSSLQHRTNLTIRVSLRCKDNRLKQITLLSKTSTWQLPMPLPNKITSCKVKASMVSLR